MGEERPSSGAGAGAGRRMIPRPGSIPSRAIDRFIQRTIGHGRRIGNLACHGERAAGGFASVAADGGVPARLWGRHLCGHGADPLVETVLRGCRADLARHADRRRDTGPLSAARLAIAAGGYSGRYRGGRPGDGNDRSGDGGISWSIPSRRRSSRACCASPGPIRACCAVISPWSAFRSPGLWLVRRCSASRV